MSESTEGGGQAAFSPADLTVLAHLYRGEMYRSKIWRTRLDTTTNWAVATTGLALSVTFADADSSALPIALVGLLVAIFLVFEARRYRYFDIWRTRVRLLEVAFFGPVLRGEGARPGGGWSAALADDYARLRFHISFWEAAGRRLRRNYAWIFAVLGLSYLAKLAIHPRPVESWRGLAGRAAIGPLPGEAVLAAGALFVLGLALLALTTLRGQHAAGRVGGPEEHGDPMLKLGVRF
jgi:uncharacterized membrane protein